MSKITELATGQITISEMITIELVDADGKPAAVIMTWPARSTAVHPQRFPSAAENAARLFAAAATRLAQIRRDRRP